MSENMVPNAGMTFAAALAIADEHCCWAMARNIPACAFGYLGNRGWPGLRVRMAFWVLANAHTNPSIMRSLAFPTAANLGREIASSEVPYPLRRDAVRQALAGAAQRMEAAP